MSSKRRESAGGVLGKQVSSKLEVLASMPASERPSIIATPTDNPLAKKRKSRSAGAAIAKAAMQRAAKAREVVDLTERKSATHMVNRGVDKGGKPYLSISFPLLKGRPDQVLNLSLLLDLPNLTEPLLSAIIRRCEKIRTAPGRRTAVGGLVSGLATFLRAHRPSASLAQLDKETLTAYVRWQDSPAARAKRVGQRGQGCLTQSMCRNKVREGGRVLDILRSVPRYQVEAEETLKAYPKNTHKCTAGSPDNPTEILPAGILETILWAARSEISELRDRLDEGDRLLAEGRMQLQAFRVAGTTPRCIDYDKSAALRLATLVERWPGVFPMHHTVRREFPALDAAFDKSPPRLTVLSGYRYASCRDLVPLVVALAIEGAFNAETVLGLKWNGVQDIQSIDGLAVRISGYNGRKANQVQSGDAEKRVVAPYFEVLHRLTDRLGDVLPEADRGRVFVYSPKKTSRTPALAFTGSNGLGCCDSGAWKWSLNRFIERWNLPAFGLKMIRATLLDLVEQNGGGIEAWIAGGQKHFRVVEGHYLGVAARQRDQERLGVAVLLKERWVATQGRIDPRAAARPGRLDPCSATPGFGCVDVYDSPQVGQKKGRICSAYGRCPGCGLVAPDFGDPHAVAYWFALLDQIGDAAERIDIAEWSARWREVAGALLAMIDLVPDDIADEARRLVVHLPPIG